MKPPILQIFLLVFAAQAAAGAEKNIAAVLSMEGGAYTEAFSAFQAAYGGKVDRYDLSNRKPGVDKDTRLVVTFGGKAAAYPYPEGSRLVYCLAPNFFAQAPAREAKSVKVSLTPDFPVIFSTLKRIQPGLKRLHILWTIPDASLYAQAARTEGRRHNIQVTAYTLEGADSLPGALRNMLGAADAIWLPPDPLITNLQNLTTLREFSWNNGIPFYGSTRSMTREGALASVGASFAEMGKAAARAARSLDNWDSLPGTIFPEKAEITLNPAAAKKLGIAFPQSILEEAGYVLP